MKEQKTPILIVTSDRWSRDSYVVFEGDQIIGWCVPDEWVNSAYDEASENDNEVTREQVEEEMEEEFFSENTDVDECWTEHGICRAGEQYYRYHEDGTGHWIDEDDALEIMQDVKQQRIQQWQDEQKQIESAEIVTPRQAVVMERFGIDAAEQNEIADDTTLLRKYNGRLYVYEGQLGEPAQWRLLQAQPHMPTGTLRRPEGAEAVHVAGICDLPPRGVE